jgi:cell division protein ZapA (FtsZ GTPase activity inhibitor)
MNLLEKIQTQPESTRKLIVWIIAGIIAISFSFWRVNVFLARINELKENEKLFPFEYQSEGNEIKEQLREIKEVLDETKEISGTIKETSIAVLGDILLVQEYIKENSENPEIDLKRIEEDKEFFDETLEKAKENNNEI